MPLSGAHDETIAGDEFGDVVGVFGPTGLSTSGLLVYARDTTAKRRFDLVHDQVARVGAQRRRLESPLRHGNKCSIRIQAGAQTRGRLHLELDFHSFGGGRGGPARLHRATPTPLPPELRPALESDAVDL